MATHKPFRQLIKPGSNFEFVGKSRMWVTISILLILASIAMLFVNRSVRGDYLNWTIDFKGGTEMIFEFRDAADPAKRVKVDPGDVRAALQAAGYRGFDVSDDTWEAADAGGASVTVHGMMVRTPEFGALGSKEADRLLSGYVQQFEAKCVEREKGKPDFKDGDCAVVSAGWSGDRLFVRTRRPVVEAEALAFFTESGHTMKPWGEMAEEFVRIEEGTGEYNAQLSIEGLDAQYREALDKGIDGVKAHVVQVYGVGAKAGAQLRNDGIKSLFYAMMLIMLYLAFRFDIRYAPGAVVALLHDSIIVTGVFAVTWTDVSLTTVAALLTVIGYSVNDTVIVFDRIRENVGRLKDKKLVRIINISINETLSRTLLTASTTFVVTLAMNLFGTGLVKNFAFTMNVGIIIGTYSSIFIASPILLYLDQRVYPAKGPVKGEGVKSGGRRKGKPEDEAEEPEEPMEPEEDEPAEAKA
jgi:preprotein translocase subunit SecF